ncbi:50S ribosomal protein L21 [Magnetococcales bacterium HHB-1]
MYAVVRTGGKQYRVEEGDLLRVEKLPGEKGDTVALNDVLLVADDDGVKTGEAVAERSVSASILRQGRGKKIIVFKKKRRKNYRRKQGHRQAYTDLRITQIQ